ncbi:uncharacterized protein LOC131076687 isoform X2 [Cryptomeria japonica]|uniref:uncharacterized protein LOC131076687 isoform X2 n=1 Tax=Cryptomeria japonica TaxID=3369 RepID=UPI0027DA2532|nr:uncharacterized protein LOC131076687 isoform X2 [Cryptomeria japonica]
MDRENVLEAIYEDDYLDNEDFMSDNENLMPDVDMMDVSEGAASEDGELKKDAAPDAPDNDLERVINNSKCGPQSGNFKKKRRRKKKKNNNSVGNVNRFVINTCRQLREPKSYLLWETISKFGVLAVRNFVEEVFTIESHGGQMTADGKRRRTPGGILWSILKSRDPEAYKEIMLKGKEIERQLKKNNSKGHATEFGGQPNTKRTRLNSADSSDGGQTTEVMLKNFSDPFRDGQPEINLLQENSWQGPLVKAWVDGIKTKDPFLENNCRVGNVQVNVRSEKVKVPVRDRIRVPVGYDDLIVENTTEIEANREENGHLQDSI